MIDLLGPRMDGLSSRWDVGAGSYAKYIHSLATPSKLDKLMSIDVSSGPIGVKTTAQEASAFGVEEVDQKPDYCD